MDRLVMNAVEEYHDSKGILDQYTQEEKNLINTFLCTTSLSIYRRWEDDGRALPTERMIELTSTMLVGGVAGLKHCREETEKTAE